MSPGFFAPCPPLRCLDEADQRSCSWCPTHTPQFVVTFPRAYHAGFSLGYNVAEAVNFAPPDCLPFMRNAQACYRHHKHTPVFSVERLLVRLAMRNGQKNNQERPSIEARPCKLSPSIADWLLPELDMIVRQELHERETLLAAGYRSILTLGHSPMTATSRASCTGEKAAANANELRLLSQATNQFQMLEDDLLTCFECDRLLYLSGVTCVMGGPRPRAGQTAGGGGYRAKQLSAPHQPTAHDSAPLSACLSHAHSLHQMCSSRQAAPSSTSNGGNLAVGSNIEHPDGSVLTPSRGATLVTWRRHNDEFLRSLCARVAARAAKAVSDSQ